MAEDIKAVPAGQPFHGVYAGRKVLVTGHTGFKGSWLCEWLLQLGAEVHGFALDPLPEAVLFGQLGLAGRLAADHRGDLAERDRLVALVAGLAPEFVFHLAAQPLVRRSYEIPTETFFTNVMGTIHVLEALRLSGQPAVAVMVTTDKCYENREWLHAYREEDPVGGHDPYSASKGAAEIAIAAWRRSYFLTAESPVKLASARAGNVIGGGDWAPDRIVPDCLRAIQNGRSIPVRNRVSTRPWQHVLEPLAGYLHLAAVIQRAADSQAAAIKALCGAFNFGPTLASNRSVADLVVELIRHTGGTWHDAVEAAAPHEAGKLNLATDKAFHLLNWRPVWDFAATVRETAAWYLGTAAGADPGELTRRQIEAYTTAAAAAGVGWIGAGPR
jgi:CDP-glucose 4,6-dehydratase